MYQVEMYYTIKPLLESGKSQRGIAKILGIHRLMVKKITDQVTQGNVQPRPIEKQKLLTPYLDQKLYDGYSSVFWLNINQHEEPVAGSYPSDFFKE